MTDPTNDQPTTPPPAPGSYGQPSAYQPAQPAAYQQQDPYAPTGGYAPPAYGAEAPKKTLSLIGMIVGIVGVVSFGWFLPASIAALVLGYLGRKREGAPAKGFWLTAIITGWVGVALTIVIVGGVILLGVIAAASGDYNSYDY